MKGRGFQFDFVDQLIVLLVAVVILAANLGWIDSSIVAFWPVALVVIVLKELLYGHK